MRYYLFLFTFLTILPILSRLEAGLPLVQELSLSEKIGQLLIVHFNGEEVNAEAQALIEQAHVGGFIYYRWSNGLRDPYQVQTLSLGLQKLALEGRVAIPLFIVVDQEGGIVERLQTGFTRFPGSAALAQTGRTEWAEASAFARGEELRAVGVNMNLAPVVDVNSNPLNPVIGVRAYGNRAEDVALFGQSALRGYRRSQMIATLKHFPGHGDVAVDSHEGLPIITKSRQEWETTDLYPFKKLANQVDAIMTGHLKLLALDANSCATLSPLIVQGFLRDSLGFQGVIMTDSLVMQGLLNCCPNIEEAAIRSLEAGHDLLLLGGRQINGQANFELTSQQVLKIHQALVEAVQQGRIAEDRINASVQRILKLKSDYSLDRLEPLNAEWISKKVNTLQHQQLAQTIAKNSIKICQAKITLPIDFQKHKVAIFAPDSLAAEIKQMSLAEFGPSTHTLFFKQLNPTEEEKEQALLIAEKEADMSIICLYNGWKYTKQIELIAQLKKLEKPLIALVLRDPQDADLLDQVPVVICTYSPTAISIQAAIERLRSKNE